MSAWKIAEWVYIMCHIDAIEGYNALHLSVQNDRLLTAHYLLQVTGMDIDATDKEGHTALHWAAYQGLESMTWYLIAQHADLNKVDNMRCTALHWCALQGNVRIARILVKQGIDMELKDSDGYTAKE